MVSTAKKAKAAAAVLSFTSFLCLLLLNLSAPIINSIYIASFEVDKDNIDFVVKIKLGVYDICEQAFFDNFTISNICTSILHYSERATIVLLAMHGVGLVMTFMFFFIGVYSYSRNINNLVWIIASPGPLIILLAMAGQIDFFLKGKKDINFLFGANSINDATSAIEEFGNGFILVIISFVCSILTVFAFYIGGKKDAIIDDSNYNGNMSTVLTGQVPTSSTNH